MKVRVCVLGCAFQGFKHYLLSPLLYMRGGSKTLNNNNTLPPVNLRPSCKPAKLLRKNSLNQKPIVYQLNVRGTTHLTLALKVDHRSYKGTIIYPKGTTFIMFGVHKSTKRNLMVPFQQ